MDSEIAVFKQFISAAHKVDDRENEDVSFDGEVAHETMAGYTVEQIMKGTGLKFSKLRQVMRAVEDTLEHWTHETQPTRYALKGSVKQHKVPGYKHNHGLDFGEE